MTFPRYWGAVAAALMALRAAGRDADAVLESGIEVGDGVDVARGRFDVEEVVDAVPAAR